MVWFTLYDYCASYPLDYLKSSLESKSLLPISEFSGYHCIQKFKYNLQMLIFKDIYVEINFHVYILSAWFVCGSQYFPISRTPGYI